MTRTTPEMGQPSHVNTTDASKSTPWTPAHHAKVNKTKPIRLLELGEGEHGKNARFEFPEGWQRTIDLPTQADGWHPLFSDLPQEDGAALRSHVAQPVVIGPDGERRQSLGLSFTSCTLNKRGHWTGDNHFDVPEEKYADGRITGLRCAAELLEALQRGYGPHISLRDVIREAINVKFERGGGDNASRWGAACGFMGVIEESVKFLAEHGRHADWIAKKIEKEERYLAHCAERDAQEKAAFVERMRKARAAKRAAREEGGNHGRA